MHGDCTRTRQDRVHRHLPAMTGTPCMSHGQPEITAHRAAPRSGGGCGSRPSKAQWNASCALRHSQCNYRVLSLSHSQALAVQGLALRGHHRPVPRRAELLAGVRFQHWIPDAAWRRRVPYSASLGRRQGLVARAWLVASPDDDASLSPHSINDGGVFLAKMTRKRRALQTRCTCH